LTACGANAGPPLLNGKFAPPTIVVEDETEVDVGIKLNVFPLIVTHESGPRHDDTATAGLLGAGNGRTEVNSDGRGTFVSVPLFPLEASALGNEALGELPTSGVLAAGAGWLAGGAGDVFGKAGA